MVSEGGDGRCFEGGVVISRYEGNGWGWEGRGEGVDVVGEWVRDYGSVGSEAGVGEWLRDDGPLRGSVCYRHGKAFSSCAVADRVLCRGK